MSEDRGHCPKSSLEVDGCLIVEELRPNGWQDVNFGTLALNVQSASTPKADSA